MKNFFPHFLCMVEGSVAVKLAFICHHSDAFFTCNTLMSDLAEANILSHVGHFFLLSYRSWSFVCLWLLSAICNPENVAFFIGSSHLDILNEFLVLNGLPQSIH